MFGKSSERGSRKRGSSTTSTNITTTTSTATSPTSQHPLSEPVLSPDVFGDLPNDMSIYYSGTSEDKKTHYFFLSDDTSAQTASSETESTTENDERTTPPHNGGTIKPVVAFEIHQGMVKHQITLHNGPSPEDPPLALGGNESSFRSAPIIGIPQKGEVSVGNNVVPIDHSTKTKNELWTFASATPTSHSPESFQWRTIEMSESHKEEPLERDLIRTNPGPNLPEEIVGTWSAEHIPIIEDPSKGAGDTKLKLGTFMFEGVARDGELGNNWRLLAVMSLLRMNQTRWEAMLSGSSVGTIKLKAGRVWGAGVETSLGMLQAGAFFH